MDKEFDDDLDEELQGDEGLDDGFIEESGDTGSYSEGGEQHLGERQFSKTLEDKDYYKNKDEELKQKISDAEEEAGRDTKTIPPEKEEGADDKKSVDEDNKDESEDSVDANAGDDSKSNGGSSDSSEENKKENSDSNESEGKEKKNVTDEDGVVGKDKEGRPIVAKNADGSTVVQKNEKDHRKDQKNIRDAKKDHAVNKINETLSKAYAFNHPIEATKQKVKAAVKKKVRAIVIKVLPYVVGGIAVLLLVIILVSVILGLIAAIAGVENEDESNYGYYDARCQEITVIGDYAGTYDLETYVAGVVQREVGFWNNLTVDEVFAIAARSYGLANADENCAIENSTSKQVFTPYPGPIAVEAAANTRGIIVVDESNNPRSVQYDAFAEASHDANFYTLKQKNQKIPTSWVESNISQSKLLFYKAHNHGHGLSQWGSLYLANVQGKNYEEIIKFYLDDVIFKSTYMGAGLEGVPDYPLDSNGTTILKGQGLDTFLASKGSSLAELNGKISSNVDNAGRGTRAGVVTAAVTLLGELNKYGIRIPYFWGGGHGDGPANGALAKWGSSSCKTSNGRMVYNACGLDCSGFVSWALYNGGVNVGVRGAGSFHKISGASKVSLDPSKAVLQPGDIMESRSHVVLVVGVSSNSYVVAEASGLSKGVLFQTRSFGAGGYWGVNMSGVYGG